MTPAEKSITNKFHTLYYDGPREAGGRIYEGTRWMGVAYWKCPLDLWIYQEIISEIAPDLIVETGTHRGGSALFMAHMLDIVGKGEIITIDIEEKQPLPQHPRIRYVTGSSGDAKLVGSLLDGRPPGEKRMVILDADHTRRHVAVELELFAPHVSVGSYLIVEDTNVNGHPVLPRHGDGPYEAVTEFLSRNKDFVVDESREKFLLTFNPRGFLYRVA